jgi:tripartite-type tricarboxylate transporter receptor subunit TctC
MLSKRLGIDVTHVPYKGADALNDLLAGRLQFMFATIPSVIQHIQGGKLLPIAMSSAKRSRSLPEVPTVIESGLPAFEAGAWFGFFGPKGTPEPVIAKLNRTVNEILALPSIEKQMISQGADPVGGSPAEFGHFVQREYEKWKLVVLESGATAE